MSASRSTPKQTPRKKTPDGHSGIPLHFGLLNVWLLDSHQDAAGDLARHVEKRVVDVGETRTRHGRMPYLKKGWKIDGNPVDLTKDFFRPRVYATYGTFDVAACFLTPDWSLVPQSKELTEVGQLIQVSLIPRKPPGAAGGDFNEAFIADYRRRPEVARDDGEAASGGQRLDQDVRFVGIFKLKISAAVTWPDVGDDATTASRHVRTVFRALWDRVARWRADTRCASRGRPRGIPPVVCVGLGLGWNEYVVVAHTDAPGKLLQLSLDLRRLWLPTIPRDEKRVSHAFAATLVTTGVDYRIRGEAAQRLKSHGQRRGKARGASSKASAKVPAAEVRKLAMEIAGDDAPAPSDLPPTYFRTGFAVYPGHEERVCTLLAEAERDLRETNAKLLYHSPEGFSPIAIELGRQDVVGPVLAVGDGGFTPTQAAAYIACLLPWVRRNGECEIAPDTILNYFNSFTRVGCGPVGKDDEFPSNHSPQLPRDARRSMALDRATGKWDPAGGSGRDAIDHLLGAVRQLQFPYMLTEHIVNLVTAFRWAHHHEILWEENLEFAPLYMCLMGRMRSAAEDWDRAYDGVPGEEAIPDHDRATWTHNELVRLHEELHKLLSAFRNVFHSRLLTGYVADDLADVNLRYRGSVHQFLSVANMVLDSLAGMLLGPRACVATFGDASSPEVENPCDVIRVILGANSLATPLLLDSIGHELGHLLLKELGGLGLPRFSGSHPWSGRRWLLEPSRNELRESYAELDRRVFGGGLLGHVEFVESTSDLIERHLLRFETLDDWVQSFMLRATLAAVPVDRDPKEPPPRFPDRVPHSDSKLLLTAVLRTALVVVAEALAEWDERSLDRLKHDLIANRFAALRATLLEKCVVGPAGEVSERLLDATRWRKFVEESVVDGVPWLARRENAVVAKRAFVALIGHARAGGGATDDPLCLCILAAMRDLRNSVIPCTVPSIHLRFWDSDKAREDAKNWAPDGGYLRRDSQGWPLYRAVPQPLSLVAAAEDGRDATKGDRSFAGYRSAIAQRGFVYPLTDDAMRKTSAAESAFYADLMAYLPAWRSSLLHRIDRVEYSAGPSKRAR